MRRLCAISCLSTLLVFGTSNDWFVSDTNAVEAEKHNNIGKDLLTTDRAGAKLAFKRAVSLASPGSIILADATMGLASVLHAGGQFREASNLYSRIAKNDPEPQAREFAKGQLEEVNKMRKLKPRKLNASVAGEMKEAYHANVRGGQLPGKCESGILGWRGALAEESLNLLQSSMPPILKHVALTMRQLTNWYASTSFAKPTNAMERVIGQLRPLVPMSDEELLGAEWWFRNHSSQIGQNFHVDQDLTSTDRLNKVPAFSSILYLSNEGGPTYIFQQKAGVNGELNPAIPLNATVGYPERGMFIVFNGNLVHGVLPPTQNAQGERLVLIVNWWRRQPGRPKCDIFPAKLSNQMALKKHVLDEVVLLHDLKREVHPTCYKSHTLWNSSYYSNFGLFNLKLPVPSAHVSGQILTFNWIESSQSKRDPEDL